MSQTRYLKSMITPTLVEPTENHEAGVASGVWSVQDQLEARRGSVWPEAGVTNPDTLIESNFSIDLYDGSSGLTITNGINLAGKGGMVWGKSRNLAESNWLVDSNRGTGSNSNFKYLRSDSSAINLDIANRSISTFNSNGFTFQGGDDQFNGDGNQYCTWTFKKAPKFFDVVTYTGTGSARTIAHSLGSTVGMMLIKNTANASDAGRNWAVYHRANTAAPQTDYLILNTNVATADSADWWNDTAPTTSVFTVGTNNTVNADGESYVAYLFAHETGSDSMIQCGSYTGNGNATGPSIDLGWEPQWLLTKASTRTSDWSIVDSMRGVITGGVDQRLHAQSSEAEPARATHSVDMIDFNAEGFNVTNSGTIVNGNTETYIYVAIRRPNMATITDATEVFAVAARTGTDASGSSSAFVSGFPVDFGWVTRTTGTTKYSSSRLAATRELRLDVTNAEGGATSYTFDSNSGMWGQTSALADQYAYMWRRAKGYFDVVTYTGNDTARTIAHGLGVVPEMIWVKTRSSSNAWWVYYGDNTDYLVLNTTAATVDSNYPWQDTSPTSSVFTVGDIANVNENNATIIAYLFATLAGVSKIGTVTHSGSSTDVDCGFTAGARFVLLKRTDATGDWYYWDSVRGIVAGNDPYSLINTAAADVTNTDLIDPLASGFQISGDFTDGDYIFYAIA